MSDNTGRLAAATNNAQLLYALSSHSALGTPIATPEVSRREEKLSDETKETLRKNLPQLFNDETMDDALQLMQSYPVSWQLYIARLAIIRGIDTGEDKKDEVSSSALLLFRILKHVVKPQFKLLEAFGQALAGILLDNGMEKVVTFFYKVVLSTLEQTQFDLPSHTLLLKSMIVPLIDPICKHKFYIEVVERFVQQKSIIEQRILNFLLALYSADPKGFSKLESHYQSQKTNKEVISLFAKAKSIGIAEDKKAHQLTSLRQEIKSYEMKAEMVVDTMSQQCAAIFNCLKPLHIVGATNVAAFSNLLRTAFKYINAIDASNLAQFSKPAQALLKQSTVFSGEFTFIPTFNQIGEILHTKAYAHHVAHYVATLNIPLDDDAQFKEAIEDHIAKHIWLEVVTAIGKIINSLQSRKTNRQAADEQYWYVVKTLRFLLLLNKDIITVLRTCANASVYTASPLETFRQEFGSSLNSYFAQALHTVESPEHLFEGTKILQKFSTSTNLPVFIEMDNEKGGGFRTKQSVENEKQILVQSQAALETKQNVDAFSEEHNLMRQQLQTAITPKLTAATVGSAAASTAVCASASASGSSNSARSSERLHPLPLTVLGLSSLSARSNPSQCYWPINRRNLNSKIATEDDQASGRSFEYLSGVMMSSSEFKPTEFETELMRQQLSVDDGQKLTKDSLTSAITHVEHFGIGTTPRKDADTPSPIGLHRVLSSSLPKEPNNTNVSGSNRSNSALGATRRQLSISTDNTLSSEEFRLIYEASPSHSNSVASCSASGSTQVHIPMLSLNFGANAASTVAATFSQPSIAATTNKGLSARSAVMVQADSRSPSPLAPHASPRGGRGSPLFFSGPSYPRIGSVGPSPKRPSSHVSHMVSPPSDSDLAQRVSPMSRATSVSRGTISADSSPSSRTRRLTIFTQQSTKNLRTPIAVSAATKVSPVLTQDSNVNEGSTPTQSTESPHETKGILLGMTKKN